MEDRPMFKTIKELSKMLDELNYKDKADPTVLNIDLEEIVHFMDGIIKAQTDKDPLVSAANVLKQFCAIFQRRVDHLQLMAIMLSEKVERQMAAKYDNVDADEAAAADNNPDSQARKKPLRKKIKCIEGVFSEFYADTELKPGKNLGLVTDRSSKRFTTKKSLQKAVFEDYCHEPVDLIYIEGEFKGPPFYNSKGDLIGNLHDFTLNRCMATRHGWNLLPICNSSLIKKEGDPPDYDTKLECGNLYFPYPDDEDDARNKNTRDDGAHNEDVHNDDAHDDDGHTRDIPLSPDEGLGPSLPCSQQTRSTQESVPTLSSQDEGIVCGSSDSGQPEEENEDLNNSIHGVDLNDFASGEDPEPSINFPFNKTILPEESDVCQRKRKWRKKDLPEKLERFKSGLKPIKPLSLGMYCSKTFAAPDPKIAKEMASAGMHMYTKAFMNYKNFYSTLALSMQALKEKRQKRVGLPKEDIESTEMDFLENIGQMGSDMPAIEENRDGSIASPAPDLGNCDEVLSINNGAPGSTSLVVCPIAQAEEQDLEEPVPVLEERVLDLEEQERAEIDMMQHEAFDDVSFLRGQPEVERTVTEWRELVDPYVRDVASRTMFDVNVYKVNLLNAFPPGDAKQGKHTISFREFTKNMPKYEIHRYFTAMLPLANVENISMETVYKGSTTEDIYITLRHRNLHHEDIEKFGDKTHEH